jgi:hypothetical protein
VLILQEVTIRRLVQILEEVNKISPNFQVGVQKVNTKTGSFTTVQKGTADA